jgi:hypothetical protein
MQLRMRIVWTQIEASQSERILQKPKPHTGRSTTIQSSNRQNRERDCVHTNLRHETRWEVDLHGQYAHILRPRCHGCPLPLSSPNQPTAPPASLPSSLPNTSTNLSSLTHSLTHKWCTPDGAWPEHADRSRGGKTPPSRGRRIKLRQTKPNQISAG